VQVKKLRPILEWVIQKMGQKIYNNYKKTITNFPEFVKIIAYVSLYLECDKNSIYFRGRSRY